MTGNYEKAVTHLENASARLTAMESWRPEVAIMKVNAFIQLSQVYQLLGRQQQMAEKAAVARELASLAGYPEGVALSRLLEEWDRFLNAVPLDPEAGTSGRILVWIVDRESVEMVSVPVSPDEMKEIVCLGERPGQLVVSSPDSGSSEASRGVRPLGGCADQEGLSRKYFAKLLTPALPHVHHERLVLVPHGVLHYVPFAALRDPENGRFLLQTKTLSYAPSVSVLRFLAAKASSFDGEVLVMGDAATALRDLPWAEDEAQTVAGLFGTKPLVGTDASESRIGAASGKVDLLHLAAHGVYRPQTPRFSHIALAAGGGDDGRLEVEEVFSQLDLRGVNLVTLSACQTALGERTNGDEILSLTRAFLYAGSPAVVSTLWWVDDRSTAFLMKAFYEHLLAGGSYAEALRAAQLETSRQPGWSDPYYWAAFTLTGNPTGRWKGGKRTESP